MAEKTQAKKTTSPTTKVSQNGNGKPTPERASTKLPYPKEEIIADYRLANQSRQASLLGRREVLTGKAKFGIFGDGKEVPQIAMAKVFRKGDFRSGYYRDQTFMFATGMSTIQEFFAQLYANPSLEAEPASGGRMMNGHFASRSLNDDGTWKDLTAIYNTSADISPTSGQMPRLVGLAYASKLYRQLPALKALTTFSKQGNEIAFGTIGNASTSEGLFFESINAAGVLKIPMFVSVWDDGYGISVPASYQTCKESISKALAGFADDGSGDGYIIEAVPGWDYTALCAAYERIATRVRTTHSPALLHVTELTQPQGHSTSGSHERYKSKERLAWEQEFDCNRKMREWMIASDVITESALALLEAEDKDIVAEAKRRAWEAYLHPIQSEIAIAADSFQKLAKGSSHKSEIEQISSELQQIKEPFRKDTMTAVNKVLRLVRTESHAAKDELLAFKTRVMDENTRRYGSHVYSESAESAFRVPEIPAQFSDAATKVDGRQVLQACFDAALARDARVFAIGEDIGAIGDVNKAFEDLQAKHGMLRVTDTGIREATILGQAIGTAMRGLRPIVEIQYLDYLLFALQTMSDDLATLQWRTMGGQKAPVIVRTRGHRLEGVWHSGSPMGMILSAIRGMFVLVPRNMTQAAGFYNTMLASDDTALIVEVLNGYRLKETIPSNMNDFTLPIGVPEILRKGSDVTLVTYGACCKVAMDAAETLEGLGVSLEVIDVQSLLPFDIHNSIVDSLKKTNRIVFFDEDVPGGATSFMMREVLERENGYRYLDSQPVTITAKEHRPAYGTDGDYFSKPQADEVVDAVYALMRESNPNTFVSLT
jgi:2-oxoisovalerate dehydrogenase E1 component